MDDEYADKGQPSDDRVIYPVVKEVYGEQS